MVTPAYYPNVAGGGEISCHLLVNELAKFVDIDVISFDGNITQQTDVDGVKVKRIKLFSKSKIVMNIQAYEILKHEVRNYDIFHTYNMTLMPAIGKLTRDDDINSIATLNGIIFSISMSNYLLNKHLNPKFYRNKILMKYIKYIKQFVTLCPFYRDNWFRDGLSEDKITIIPNMIDPNLTIVNRIEKKDGVKLLFVGNYAKWRNLKILLEAYSNIQKKGMKLIIVGEGWGNLVSRWKGKQVENLGRVSYNKMPEIYASADILVQPYIFPVPVSRTLLESMQNELAVITTGNNYYSPIIRNGKDGILLYPMETENLAESLQQLVDDKNLRENLAKNGKKRVYEICSPHNIVKEYINVYERMIK